MKLIFELTQKGRSGVTPPANDTPATAKINPAMLRSGPAELPEVSEPQVVRHYTNLSRKNFGVDNGFYPLGSCTMKYNPKINERVAGLAGFTDLHPLLPQLPTGNTMVQGSLEVLYRMDRLLREICGMAAFTLQPLAGSHGELTGVMIMAAYHRDRGNKKTTVIIPDSAHGTNPASAAIAGYTVKTVASNSQGVMDVDALRAALDDSVAGLMLTVPNTLGLFNPHVKEITDLIHSVDGLCYCDGANLNALLGQCRPGDIGFDIMHVNLHKTFATPHGGGGPGAGPVGVCAKLVDYLPVSVVCESRDGEYHLDYNRPKSIGFIAPFYGNFAIIVRALAYCLQLGGEGLKRVSENAVLNANYIREKLKDIYALPCPQICKHECVFSADNQLKHGVHALDIAKALIDRGYHPPTVYFPLTVHEALMIEPTECESRETLDAFIAAMREIAALAESAPESFADMPVTTPVSRLDEATAARKPDLASLGQKA